ncbi:MAG TPA: hypothetical protein VLX91_13830 [Candidatus Acidoferrales bacterium]|nr:hypothetical protein [Candidatus Acidoferrales bacterium]
MIVVKNQNPDGTITDFTPDQFFEVGIDSGNAYGTILSQGDTSQYFARRPQPLQFIAVDSISADSEIVGVRVGWEQEVPCSTVPGVKENSGQNRKAGGTTVDANLKNTSINPPAKKVNILPVHRKSVSDAPNFSSGYYGIGYEVIKPHIILLGETKYYYATPDPHNSGNLIIKETKTEPPALGDGGIASAKFNDPVAAGGSEKNPVYWEYKWPKYDGTQFQQMEKLPDGMIRLVGRYWEQGKTFKTKLTAHTSDGRSGSIVIEVKKPGALLTAGQSPSYDPALDIRNAHISIDSLCIRWGGQYGIPPQLLKSEILREAHVENQSVWPTYRYEPWQDLRSRADTWASSYMSQPYWVTGTGTPNPMGVGTAVPTSHQNVRPILSFSQQNAYPNTPTRIGDYVADNYKSYYQGVGLSKDFNALGAPDQVRLYWYALVKKYRSMYKINPSQAVAFANADMKDFLRANYAQWAQTRKGASYGFLQVLYTTAIMSYCGYPQDNTNAPENLDDENNHFPIACKFIKHNVVKVLSKTKNNYDIGKWQLGFEETFREGYVYYNQGSGYGSIVLTNARMFDPSN